MNMPSYRLCRKVYVWDRDISSRYKNTWYNFVKVILEKCDLGHLLEIDSHIPTRDILDTVKERLRNDFENTWTDEINNMPKLRTYKLLKSRFCAEPYVLKCLSRPQRSAIARIRCGTFPLEIERGRFRSIPLDQRICKVCNSGCVEDEKHFLIECERYSSLRSRLLADLDLSHMSPIDAFKQVLTLNYKSVSNFILDCDKLRRNAI